MTASVWLDKSVTMLTDAGVGTARLDALVLLEDVTGIDRAKLLAETNFELSSVQLKKLNNLLKRRATHEPLAYVRGKCEFYGRTFLVTSDVLVPRPESETMIDELKKLPNLPNNVHIGDVGTGSGALGITANFELPGATTELIDIDPKALKIAKSNVDYFTIPINVILSDLLTSATTDYDVLLCNLPYVPDNFRINTAATYEPKLAIYGGEDGLDLYRGLFDQIVNLQKQPLYLLLESLPSQHEALAKIATQTVYNLVSKNDFILVLKCIK